MTKIKGTDLVHSITLEDKEIRILYDKNTSDIFIRIKEVSDIVGFEIKSTVQGYKQKHKDFANSFISKGLSEIRYSNGRRAAGNPTLLAAVFTKDTVESVFVPGLIAKIGDKMNFVKKIIDVYFRANELLNEALAELTPPEPEVVPDPVEETGESVVSIKKSDLVKTDTSISNENLSKVLTNGFNALADAMRKQTEMLKQISGYGSVADSKDSSEASRKAEELSLVNFQSHPSGWLF